MRVALRRSGGFAGLSVECTVDTEELSREQADELRALVERADVERLAGRSPIRGRGADRFQYDLSVTEGERRHDLTISEDAAPAEVKALVRWLLARRAASS